MGLKVGIVGLPNVGKSTLFNAITNLTIEANNYPFATINPNFGVVEINDARIDKLVSVFQPAKVVKATIEFVDIAGLIRGASKGEGMGNAFLANIRNADAVCMVVRCFANNDIVHVEGTINPIRDVEIISLELSLADDEQIARRMEKIHKQAQMNKEFKTEVDLLDRLRKHLKLNLLLRDLPLTKDEYEIVKPLNLITLKPFIFVANISETDLVNNKDNEYVQALKAYGQKNDTQVITICAKVEEDLSQMSDDEKTVFMNEYHIKTSGLNQLATLAYQLLNLKTYFTCGPSEVHAWTFKTGMNAAECAGLIHTDFEKGFIKADIYNYTDFVEYTTERVLRENGKIRLEGKNYLMQDGDICLFKFKA